VRSAAAPARVASRTDQGVRALLRAPVLAPTPALAPAPHLALAPVKESERPKIVAPPSPAPATAEKKPEKPEPTKEEKPRKEEKPPTQEGKPATKEEKPAKEAPKGEKPTREAPKAEKPAAAAAGSAPAPVSPAPTTPVSPAPATPAKPESKPGAAAPQADKKQPEGAAAQPVKVPGLKELKDEVRKEARKQRRHPKPHDKRTETEAATALPEPEQNEQSSKEKSEREMGRVAAEQKAQQQQRAQYNAEAFKKDFRDLVAKQKAPQSEDAVKEYAEKPPVQGSTEAIQSNVAEKQGQMVKPLQEQLTTLPRPDDPKKADELKPPRGAPKPGEPDASLAAPAPREGVEAEMKRQSDSLDSAMEKNRLSDDQLAESREPQFIETLEAKNQAKQKLAEAPGVYRAREAEILQSTQAQAAESMGGGLKGMAGVHRATNVRVHKGQGDTENNTETRQKEIKGKIVGIQEKTVKRVGDILGSMATQIKDYFVARLKFQSTMFNVQVRSRISDYYGNWRIDDKLFGPADVVIDEHGNTRAMTFDEMMGRKEVPGKLINPDVWRIFKEEKEEFLDLMDAELDVIARSVETRLTAAATAISDGEAEIAGFKKTLSGKELEYADELEADVKMKFDILRGSIDAAREDLLQELADQYNETVNQLEVSFNEINDELKKSWLDRAIEFIETVGKTIFQLVDLVISILSRLASLVWKIIKHPIRFFETLVSGLGQGISMFVKNFGTYLQEAFWTWLTGASPARNIRLSVGSGVESLFDLVLQVLDLGQEGLRAIVEKVFGKKFMQGLDKVLALADKAIEPLTILLTKGPLALWEHLREQLGTLVHSTFERIKESVFFAFVEKGLKWIAGFFVPGGGFVKVVKAVVAAFQFVADNLERLRVFFDSVFDSLEAAVEGRTEVVANKIIVGLKMGIVLALDFLAKQLGLDKIVGTVQKIIQSLRRPIVAAIEWLLRKVKPFVMKLVTVAVKAGKKVLAVGKKAVARVRAWWRARKPFTSETGEQHALYLEGGETGARIMIRSDPLSYHDFIKGVDVPANKKAAKNEALGVAGELDQAVASAARGRTAPATGAPSLDKDPSAQIERLLGKLAALTATFIPAGSGESSESVYGPLVHGFGSSVRVARLTGSHAKGSPPGAEGGDWEALRRRYDAGGTYYVRGHLLNDNLGGPGTWPNLTPLTQTANNRGADSMLHKFETAVKDRVAKTGSRVDFTVTANYSRSHRLASWVPALQKSENAEDREIGAIVRAEEHIPTTLDCESHDVLVSGEQKAMVAKHTVKNVIDDASVDDYQLGPEPVRPFYIDEVVSHGDVGELQKLDGLSKMIIDKVFANRPPGGYRTLQQLEDLDRRFKGWDKAFATKGLRVRIYRRT
jgi:hypothetical protein